MSDGQVALIIIGLFFIGIAVGVSHYHAFHEHFEEVVNVTVVGETYSGGGLSSTDRDCVVESDNDDRRFVIDYCSKVVIGDKGIITLHDNQAPKRMGLLP